jgi:hypothetical protein
LTAATDRLVGILARDIIREEGFARELAEIAETLRRDRHHASAEAMLRLSRHHRIRGMQDRGNLAALRDGSIRREADER